VLHNNQQEAPLVDEPSDDASARAINAQAWEPPPGMVKRLCPQCRYWFAASPHTNEEWCPDCASIGQRGARMVMMIARNQYPRMIEIGHKLGLSLSLRPP
jgi:hypothetical protein